MTVNIIPFFSPLAQNEWKTQVSKRLMDANARVIPAEEFLKREAKGKRTLREHHNYLFVGTGGTENNMAQFILKAQ